MYRVAVFGSASPSRGMHQSMELRVCVATIVNGRLFHNLMVVGINDS